jgi:hypothetical protein
MKATLIALIILANIMFVDLAQAQTSTMPTIRRSFATVMFAGLGGAILGLSTLSFYGNPQNHIGNIWTGATLGVLAGGAYVIASSTRNYHTMEAYSLHDFSPRKTQQAFFTSPIINYEF